MRTGTPTTGRRAGRRRIDPAVHALVLGAVVLVCSACADTTGAAQATVTVTSQVPVTAEPETVTADPETVTADPETITAPPTTEVRTTTRTVVSSAAPPASSTPGSTSGPTASRTTPYDPAANIYVSKSVGSQARLVSPDGVTQLQAFTVTEIRPNFTCTAADPATPKLGRYLGVRISNEISADYRPGTDPVLVRMSRASMKVTSGGVTTDYLDGAPDNCLRDEDRVNPSTTPGSKSVGWIVLDTKDVHGTLYLDYPPGTPGWQWDY